MEQLNNISTKKLKWDTEDFRLQVRVKLKLIKQL